MNDDWPGKMYFVVAFAIAAIGVWLFYHFN
jgi:hypothetical protein